MGARQPSLLLSIPFPIWAWGPYRPSTEGVVFLSPHLTSPLSLSVLMKQ